MKESREGLQATCLCEVVAVAAEDTRHSELFIVLHSDNPKFAWNICSRYLEAIHIGTGKLTAGTLF